MATQSRLPAFLLTRPKAQSLRFAGQLRQALGDVQVTISPLIAPVLLTPNMPEGPFGAVVFTSETAVAASQAIAARGYALPNLAWCVGDQTAAAARALGMTVRSAGGDAEALVALIAQENPAQRLLYLHGAQTRGAVAERLTAAGIGTVGVTVYRQDAQPLTPEAQQMLQGNVPLAIPLFSPRSAAIFMSGLGQAGHRAGLHFFALSSAVDAELGEIPPAQRFVASTPDVHALIALILQRYDAGRAS
jgi:uroporphyrinogen-III synthase